MKFGFCEENIMICLNCKHMENLDYIHGVAECAALEGETMIPYYECICPENILNAVGKLLEGE